MQFSKIIIAAASASLVLATPVFPEVANMMIERTDNNNNATAPAPASGNSKVANDGMDVAACETNVAAQQTACIAACSSAACYAACGTNYVGAYEACKALY